ncbi:MAG: hypothetical protein ACLRR6_02645 [Oscillospiraceae bacterium]
MELVGIADLAPTLSLQALRERGMIGENGVKYNLYLVDGANEAAFRERTFRLPAALQTSAETWISCWTPRLAVSVHRTKRTIMKSTV